MTLDQLESGQTCVIDHVDTSDPAVLRLMTLGLVEGSEIELASTAIGGDPLEFHLYGNAISLRREQARYIQVSPKAGA